MSLSQKGVKTMTKREVIKTALIGLAAADNALNDNDHIRFAGQMHLILDLLLKELVGSAPGPTVGPAKNFNPEQILTEIAIAIKHRTISDSNRWKIIYYYKRITCVPSCAYVPPQIVLHEFTEKMVHRGFTTIYWNQLKQNVIKLYKELHK